jgi:hypothetical protein
MTDQMTDPISDQRPNDDIVTDEIHVEKVRRRTRWFFAVAYGFIGLVMRQDATYDLRNYHFFAPYWVFINHLHSIAASGEQTFINPLISTPFYFGPRYLPPMLFQFIIGTVQGLSGPLLYLIARELRLSKPVAIFAAFSGMVAATALSEIGNAQGDTLIAPLLFGALLFILRVANRPLMPSRNRLRTMALAGLMAGAAVGLKETVVCIALALGVLTLTSSRHWDLALKNAVALSAGLIVGYIATYGWWAIVLTVKFHDPLFPMYNEIIKSPWAQPTKNVGWDRSLHSISAIISYPFRFAHNGLITGVVPFRQLSFPILESLFALALVVKVKNVLTRRRWNEDNAHLGALCAFFVSAYLLWCWTTGIYRYVVVLEMLTPIFLILVIKYIGDGVNVTRWAIPLAVLVVLSVIVTQRVPNWGRTNFTWHYFTVAVPAPLNHANTTIVFVGDSPTSFIIPYFSHEPTFVRSGRVFPLVEKMNAAAQSQLRHSRHVYVMWGHSPIEDALTWTQLTTAATISTPSGPELNPYPGYLSALRISSTSSNCRDLTATVDVSTITLHYCKIR